MKDINYNIQRGQKLNEKKPRDAERKKKKTENEDENGILKENWDVMTVKDPPIKMKRQKKAQDGPMRTQKDGPISEEDQGWTNKS